MNLNILNRLVCNSEQQEAFLAYSSASELASIMPWAMALIREYKAIGPSCNDGLIAAYEAFVLECLREVARRNMCREPKPQPNPRAKSSE